MFRLRIVWIALLLLTLVASFSQAADYKLRKKQNDRTVEVAINRNPPVEGENTIRVVINDPQGKPVTDAKVSVNYYMPPMPGMPPMNYTIPAEAKNDQYLAVMDLIMTGPWNIVLKVEESGRSWRVTFPIDVR